MCLLYKLTFMVKCVRYMGLGFNGCFVTGASLTGGHYKTYIISGVGHPRSFGHAASVMDSSVQYLVCDRYCITGPSEQRQPC